MDFSGPEAADLADVRSLNIAFLDYLASPNGERFRREMPNELQGAVSALHDRHMQRLSTVPFLSDELQGTGRQLLGGINQRSVCS